MACDDERIYSETNGRMFPVSHLVDLIAQNCSKKSQHFDYFPGLGKPWLHIFDISELERLLSVVGVESSQFSLLAQEWRLRPAKSYNFVDPLHRLAIPVSIMEEVLRHDRTILLRHLQQRSPTIRAAFNCLRQAGLPVNDTVAFLSPPRVQATIPHADGHAILQLQLSGCKVWHLWDIVENDLLDYASSVDALEEIFRTHVKRNTRKEVVLRPGDMLFLPRRLVHTAINSADFSLSISFKFNDKWDYRMSESDGLQLVKVINGSHHL